MQFDLRNIPAFADLPDSVLHRIRERLQVTTREMGEVIARPERAPDGLLIVRSGCLRVWSGEADDSVRVFGAGTWLGEEALLLGPARHDTVVVEEDAELWRLSRPDFDQLFGDALGDSLGSDDALDQSSEMDGSGDAPARSLDRPESARGEVSLVLSSGGAKAIAHVGVLKVLVEERIRIDRVAGTSGGALFAALFCAGKPLGDIIEFARSLHRYVRRSAGLWDRIDPPVVGQIRGMRTEQFYDQILGGQRFHDLAVPLEIAATDLIGADVVVLDRGKVATAVRASMGIPGIYAPRRCCGRYLTDGTLVRPLPVDLPGVRATSVRIVSDVRSPCDELAVKVWPSSSNGLLGLIVTRANAIRANHARCSVAGDVLMQPDVEEFDVLDYASAEDLISRGEATARAQLDDIRQRIATQVRRRAA